MVMGIDEVWITSPADGVLDEYGEPWRWSRVDARTNELSEPSELEVRGLRCGAVVGDGAPRDAVAAMTGRTTR
jgi:hypothetical protein